MMGAWWGGTSVMNASDAEKWGAVFGIARTSRRIATKQGGGVAFFWVLRNQEQKN
jgi:hypothetical protein